MFNSREYEWADVSLVVGGKLISGARGIKYSEKQEKELLYGKGNLPLSIQKGNISYEGELTVTQSELETMTASAKGKSILNLQLDIIISYGNPSNGDMLVTDVLQGVQFTEDSKELKQGDKNMEVSLPFIFLRRKPQVA